MSTRTTRTALLVVIALQALVLVCLPLLAGARMPSGEVVTLEATGNSPKDFEGMPSNEIWLEYGFDEVELPDSMKPGDTAYLELLERGGDEPARFGDVVEAPDQLPDGATWIKLPVVGPEGGDGELENGPIGFWYSEDDQLIGELQEHLEDDGTVLVRVQLDPDGDPEVTDVRVAG